MGGGEGIRIFIETTQDWPGLDALKKSWQVIDARRNTNGTKWFVTR